MANLLEHDEYDINNKTISLGLHIQMDLNNSDSTKNDTNPNLHTYCKQVFH